MRQPATFEIDEYLALEHAATERHEYVDGVIYAMTGGSMEHAAILSNIVGTLWGRLRGKPCRAYASDLRLRIEDVNVITYPDVAIYCGDMRMFRDKKDVAMEPSVILEVLSRSTRSYDRGETFEFYQRIPTLRQYVLVHQDRHAVELFTRLADDSWQPALVRGLDASLELPSADEVLPMAEIYDGVTVAGADSTGA